MQGNTIPPPPPVHMSVHQDDILPLIVFHIPTICVLVEAREQTVYLTTTHSSFHHPPALPFYCVQKSKILHLKVCVYACEIHFAFNIISLFRLVVYMVYFVVGNRSPIYFLPYGWKFCLLTTTTKHTPLSRHLPITL